MLLSQPNQLPQSLRTRPCCVLTRARLEHAAIGIDAKVAIAQFERLVAGEALDLAAKQAAGAVDPAVESVDQAVDAALIVVRGKAAEEFLDDVGSAVAVGIFGVQNIGRGADQHAACATTVTPVGNGMSSRKTVRLVVAAVAIAVGQHPYAAARLKISLAAGRIVVHLRDPQPPVGAEVDRHRDRSPAARGDQLDRHVRGALAAMPRLAAARAAPRLASAGFERRLNGLSNCACTTSTICCSSPGQKRRGWS